MIRQIFDLFRYSWPVAIVAIVFGVVYCLLVCLLHESIEISLMDDAVRNARRGGPSTIFALNSGVMGWIIMWSLERRLGITGASVLLICTVYCGAAIIAGVGLGTVLTPSTFEVTGGLMVMCFVLALGAGGFRMFLAK